MGIIGKAKKTYNKEAATSEPAPNILGLEESKLEGRKALAKAVQIMYDPVAYREVVKMLSVKGKRPEELVATVSVNLMQRVDASSREAGEEIDDRARIMASVRLPEEVAELAKTKGLFTLSSAQVQLAGSLGTEMYLKAEIAAGRIDGEKLKADTAKGISNKELHRQLLQINKTAMLGRQKHEPAPEGYNPEEEVE